MCVAFSSTLCECLSVLLASVLAQRLWAKEALIHGELWPLHPQLERRPTHRKVVFSANIFLASVSCVLFI